MGKELLYTAHTPVVYAEVQARDAYRLPTTLSTRRADRRIVFASTRALLVMRVRWAADNSVAWVALVTAVVLKTMRRGDRVAAVNRLPVPVVRSLGQAGSNQSIDKTALVGTLDCLGGQQ